ncbi:outer membrane protein [Allorhizobium borbori]|uniref:Outer membrane immunogenic protein n=1 Tax=Allorhizobium borbori TaxID=485907 RepID=A0A7W6P0P6_9HYPH|nr:outer membrane protein [Allorhizobium borbori]MBB4102713.1 outer membrane immunogenic protein [Allorhizobium borbori]PZU22406.1 MAG: hypothetical protein DI589_10935 [Shinella sp.]
MRTILATLLASTIAVAAFSGAHAADAIDQVPEAPIANDPISAPKGNWEGAYGGAAATYEMGRFGNNKDYNARAFGGSLYGGYNLQSGQIVYGPEADIGYSGKDGKSFSGTVKGSQGVNGSIRGRVGYDLNPVMIYGTAGLAASNNEVKDATTSDSRTALGYTVGAGVEGFVTDKITARVEYRYTDYQAKNFDLASGNKKVDLDEHSVKVGVGYKF